MLIDTHAHIFLEEFDSDLPDVIDRAGEAGIGRILMPNIDSSSIEAMHKVEKSYPNVCRPMIGLHPCSVKEDYIRELQLVEAQLEKESYIAIGEIGTDLYWDKTFWNEQQEAFRVQCEFGIKWNLPVVIHCRETIDETIELVRPYAHRGLSGVFHCFTGSVAQANAIREFGFYLGIGGVSTFKNGGLKELLPEIGLNKVVLETDSPYLAPVPFRGKRNEPSYIKVVNSNLASVLGMDESETAQITTQNAQILFHLGEL